MKLKTQPKKIKKFNKFETLAYSDWHGDSEEFECEVCGEFMVYLQNKCPDCGTTYKFEKAVLQLYRPVIVKRKMFKLTMPIENTPAKELKQIIEPSTSKKSRWKVWLRIS